MITLESLLNLVADKLITELADYSSNPNNTVLENQQFVRDSVVKLGRLSADESMLVYERAVDANQQDDLTIEGLTGLICDINQCSYSEIYKTCETIECEQIATSLTIDNIDVYIEGTLDTSLAITVSGGGVVTPRDITNMIMGENNPLNISQFIPLGSEQENINITAANEFLQTTIYELLPRQRTRQQRIDAFFEEYQALKGPIPNIQDYDNDGSLEVEENYMEGHDISWAQDNPETSLVPESESFITRLEIDANQKNKDKSLETLRNDINQYLKDIDQNFQAEIPDDRPDYENKSDGYLKIRNLNQGIIIRKQEGDDIGLENLIVKSAGTSFVQESGIEYLHPHVGGDGDGIDGIGPSYLMDGFTITMWVKFLDKTSRGTLFNYGNPLRTYDPKGFRLETYVLGKDNLMTNGEMTWGEAAGYNVNIEEASSDLFQTNDYERFIRLVVYDHVPDAGNVISEPERKLYDSRLGIPGFPKEYNFIPEFGYTETVNSDTSDYQKADEKYLLSHVRVPIDFDEWYFVVASYNPMIDERIPEVDDTYGYLTNPDYWRGNIHLNGDYTHYSGLGSKCKVEVISKSDLLRARGYKA